MQIGRRPNPTLPAAPARPTGAAQAITALCASLLAEPGRIVLAARIPVASPLVQPTHTHTDILQFDIANHCGGGWRTKDGLWPAQGFTAVVFYPGTAHGHALTPLGDDSECLSIKLRVDGEAPVLRSRPYAEMARSLAQQGALVQMVRRLCRWQALGARDLPLFLSCLCEILSRWPRRQAGAAGGPALPPQAGTPALPEVVNWLEQHWRRRPALGEIARLAHLSPRQVTRCFHTAFGCTPRQYLDRLRLARAQALLWQKDRALKQIAEDLGFRSIHHFTRWFHQQAGLPPGRFRAQGIML